MQQVISPAQQFQFFMDKSLLIESTLHQLVNFVIKNHCDANGISDKIEEVKDGFYSEVGAIHSRLKEHFEDKYTSINLDKKE